MSALETLAANAARADQDVSMARSAVMDEAELRRAAKRYLAAPFTCADERDIDRGLLEYASETMREAYAVLAEARKRQRLIRAQLKIAGGGL